MSLLRCVPLPENGRSRRQLVIDYDDISKLVAVKKIKKFSKM
jgi:hypothetical protein